MGSLDAITLGGFTSWTGADQYTNKCSFWYNGTKIGTDVAMLVIPFGGTELVAAKYTLKAGKLAGTAAEAGRVGKAAETGGARFVAGADGILDTLGGSPNAVSRGHFPEYLNLGSRSGAETFSMSDEAWSSMSSREQWVRNQSFLDKGIAKGSEFRLATPVEAARPGSFYERELR